MKAPDEGDRMDRQMTDELEASFATDETAAFEQLAVAARDGAAGAFDLLARRLGGRLMAFARRTLEDRQLAEEAVQESLVRIYRSLPRYREGNILGWSFTITHRVCADVARRERRHRRAHLVALPETAPDHSDAVDVRAAVEQALAKLPPHLRETFLLHQQGLAYDDVAQVLSVPIGTVRSRLFEARRLLRLMLSATLHGGNER